MKKTIIILIMLMPMVIQAQIRGVVYNEFEPDLTTTGYGNHPYDTIRLDIDGDGVDDFEYHFGFQSGSQGMTIYLSSIHSGWKVSGERYSAGAPIADNEYWLSSASFFRGMEDYDLPGGYHYVGCRRQVGDNYYYAWIRDGYWIEDSPRTSIHVDATAFCILPNHTTFTTGCTDVFRTAIDTASSEGEGLALMEGAHELKILSGAVPIRSVFLYDCQGRCVYAKEGLNGYEHHIDMSKMSKGVYIVQRVSMNGVAKSAKISYSH